MQGKSNDTMVDYVSLTIKKLDILFSFHWLRTLCLSPIYFNYVLFQKILLSIGM